MVRHTGHSGFGPGQDDGQSVRSTYDATANVDPNAIQHQFEDLKSNSNLGYLLQNVATAKADEKTGKVRVFFMNLPPDVAGFLRFVVGTFLPFLNSKGVDFVHDKTAEIWSKNFNRPAGAHTAGLNAAKIFSAVLVGLEPLDRLINVRRGYSAERDEIMQQVTAVAPSKYDLKNNEVLQTAFDRAHDHAMVGLKQFAARLPALIGLSTLAVWDYGKLKARKEAKHRVISQAQRSDFDLVKDLESRKEDLRKRMKAENFTDSTIENALAKTEEQFWKRHSQEWSEENTKGQSSSFDEDNWKKTSGMAVLEGFGGLLNSRIGKESKKYKTAIALDMITTLAEEIETNGPSQVSVDRIVEIFQQNERDHGRPTIGAKLLPQLEPLAAQIAEVIGNGRLNPSALIRLVGDNKVIMHGRDGSRRFAKPEQVEALIDEQLKTLSSRDLMTIEEYYANFENPKRVEEILKKTLATADKTEKALIVYFTPDDVLERCGLKRREINALRAEIHQAAYHVVAYGIVKRAEENDEALKTQGFSDEEIAKLRDAAEQMKTEGMAVIKQVVDGQDKILVNALRTAFLREQVDTGSDKTWVEYVEKAKIAIKGGKLHTASERDPAEQTSRHRRAEIKRRARDGDPSDELVRG